MRKLRDVTTKEFSTLHFASDPGSGGSDRHIDLYFGQSTGRKIQNRTESQSR
jgi:hypothetical protein